MARALGRYPFGNTTLLGHIYPAKARKANQPNRATSPVRGFSTFRPIIPRSLSRNILNSKDLTQTTSDIYAFGFQSQVQGQTRQRSPSPVNIVPPAKPVKDVVDPTTHFYDKIGSTFHRDLLWDGGGSPSRDWELDLEFSSSQLQTLLGLVRVIGQRQ